MVSEDKIKLLYQKEVLYRHGDYLMDLLDMAIEKKKLKNKGELKESLSFDVKKDFAGRLILQISFLGYGRAVEIRYHKSKNQKTWAEQRRNDVWGLNRKRRKDTRWYARNVYGSINRLIAVMREEFSKEEIQRLKRILEKEMNVTGTTKIIN